MIWTALWGAMFFLGACAAAFAFALNASGALDAGPIPFFAPATVAFVSLIVFIARLAR